VPRSELVKRIGHSNPAASTPKMAVYRKFTALKTDRNKQLNKARHRTKNNTQNPYSIGDFNPNKRLRLGSGLASMKMPESQRLLDCPRVRVLNMTGAPWPALDVDATKYDMQPVDSENKLADATLRSDLVLWKHSWELDRSVPDIDFLKSAFLVTAAGKSVLGLVHWKGKRPHTSSAVVSYAAAVNIVPATIVLSEPLLSKHRALCQVIEKCGKLPDSKWTVLRSQPANSTAAVFRISTAHDARAFLQSHRRLRRHGAAGGHFPGISKTKRGLGVSGSSG
jgi:hypothetical protein